MENAHSSDVVAQPAPGPVHATATWRRGRWRVRMFVGLATFKTQTRSLADFHALIRAAPREPGLPPMVEVRARYEVPGVMALYPARTRGSAGAGRRASAAVAHRAAAVHALRSQQLGDDDIAFLLGDAADGLVRVFAGV